MAGLRCACGRSTHVPQKLLVRAHGRSAWVLHLLDCFRCQTCRRRPILAQWVSAPVGPPHYFTPKRVPLALAAGGPAAIN